MKVRVLFIHPTSGMHDATIENASSVDEVKKKLEEANCAVLTIEEEK
ncbi:hypothetical protein ANABIO32_00570 [Rossellomorea marisflavi]|nr:hypothetical protein [Rossellomorea marisflavi]GLI82371.1 hypothetical protein ANABIO32_00570 [Rossellomorea marisflavi]